ncbi:MAG: hypothetical protein J5614_09075 [Paludibacteraceae bacterium]|nr:hypothetical protein [Paludibacteraceae bacterium]
MITWLSIFQELVAAIKYSMVIVKDMTDVHAIMAAAFGSFCAGIGAGVGFWTSGIVITELLRILLLFGVIGALFFVVLTVLKMQDDIGELVKVMGLGAPFISGFIFILVLLP